MRVTGVLGTMASLLARLMPGRVPALTLTEASATLTLMSTAPSVTIQQQGATTVDVTQRAAAAYVASSAA